MAKFRLRRAGMLASALAILPALSACTGGRGGSIPYDVALAPPDPPKPVLIANDMLSPLDTVTVYVYNVPDLSRDYTVDLSGNLSMPLIGEVHALGLTTKQLQTLLEQKLGAHYLQNPNVTVSLKESQRRAVTVEGAVKSPGVYPSTGPLTLIQAVALAKGLDDLANPHRVAIFRQVGGKRMAAAFDLVTIRHGEAKDPDVYPGDTVVIDGSNMRKTERDILQAIPMFTLFTPVL